MSRRRRERGRPMPLSSAGLVRFFEEEIRGIKLRPEIVVVLTIMLMALVVLAHMHIIVP
ncbi:MAG: preprotein translocase subunit Sec61beta [Thermoprotei archaeon]|nr:MAG: preprotein translocase subunit Sec61beta [Thermoprotei archaeon]RLF25908.1 MAG: preprotein translocase subunit Sec61beta [Thermoprotei archaeon]